MKSMMKKMSILLAGALLVTSLSTSPALAAKKTKTQYGYAFKGGKLVSIEIRGDKYKETLYKKRIPFENGEYDNISVFSEGVYQVSKNGKYGLIDKSGNIILPLDYENFDKHRGVYGSYNGTPYNFGKSLVKITKKDGTGKDKHGLINLKGEIVLPAEYDYITANDTKEQGLIKISKTIKENIDGDEKSYELSGLVDKSGKILFPAEYDFYNYSDIVNEIRKGNFVYNREKKHFEFKGKKGLFNEKGKLMIPMEYDQIFSEKITKNLIKVNLDNKKYALIKKGQKTPVMLYDRIYDFQNGLAEVQEGTSNEDRKHGLINKQGRIVLPIKYDSIGKFNSGLALIKEKDTYIVRDGSIVYTGRGKSGYVNTKGEIVIPITYSGASDFSEGLAFVSEEGGTKKGFIDKTGKYIIEMGEGGGDKFLGGLAWVSGKEGTDFINKKGEVILSFPEEQYTSVDSFKYDITEVGKRFSSNNWKYGVIDKQGREVVPLEYDSVEVISNELAVVYKGDYNTGKGGLINKNGKLVLPVEYDDIRNLDFSKNGLIKLLKGDWDTGKRGVADKTGKVILPVEYDAISELKNGLLEVRKGDWETGKSGLADKTGKFILPIEYEGIRELANGLLEVRKGDWNIGKKGLIDKTGKFIIPVEFSRISDFGNGLLEVEKGEEKDRKVGLINKKGKWIIPLEYNYIRHFTKGIVKVQKEKGEENLYGLYTEKGRKILDAIYSYIEDSIEEDVFRVLKGTWEKGKQGYINQKGKFVIPLKYDYAYGFENGSPYAKVRRKGKWGLVNKRGKVIMPLKYNNIELIQE